MTTITRGYSDEKVEHIFRNSYNLDFIRNEFNKKIGNRHDHHRLAIAVKEVQARLSMNEIFLKIDTDKSGTISFEEYFAARAKGGEVPAEMKAKYKKEFKNADVNGDGELDFEEMVNYFIKQKL